MDDRRSCHAGVRAAVAETSPTSESESGARSVESASVDPVVYGPGEGEHHDAGPAQIFIKATGEHTGGSFFLAESTLAPGFAGPPPHRHRELHDMFYVLEGTLTLHSATGRLRPVPAALPVSRPVSCTPSATTATVLFACSTSTRQQGGELHARLGRGGAVCSTESQSHRSRRVAIRLRVQLIAAPRCC